MGRLNFDFWRKEANSMKNTYKVLLSTVIALVMVLGQVCSAYAAIVGIHGDGEFIGFNGVGFAKGTTTVWANDISTLQDGAASVTYSVYRDGSLVDSNPYQPAGPVYFDSQKGSYARNYTFLRDVTKHVYAGHYTAVARAVYKNDPALEFDFSDDFLGDVKEDISPDYLPCGLKGLLYSKKLTTNLDKTVTWSVYEGSLPAGVVLRTGTAASTVANSVYGEVYGVPTETGVFNFTIRVKNGTYTVDNKYCLEISEDCSSGSGSDGDSGTPNNNNGQPTNPGNNGNKPANKTESFYFVYRSFSVFKWVGDTLVSSIAPEEIEKIKASISVNSKVEVEIGNGTPSQAFETTGDFISFLQSKSATLTLNYGNVKCDVPTNAIDLDQIATSLKVSSKSEIKLNIGVNESSDPSILPHFGFKFVSKAYEMKFTATAANGNSVEVTKLKTKVKCTIPVDKTKPAPAIKGTRNVYRIHMGVMEYFSSIFDYNADCVIDIDKPGKYVVLDFNASFKDVSVTSWAYNYIQIMASRSIMINTFTNDPDEKANGKDHFFPKDVMTRGQFTSYLVKTLGIETSDYVGSFKDVSKTVWYAKYVEAAAKIGIVNGVDEGKFDADAVVTREQMAVMVARAYSYKKSKSVIEITSSYKATFVDSKEVSSWATEYVNAACAIGVIDGTADSTVRPAERATREMGAAALCKFMKALGQL